ncbi:MAG: radical SAM protein [Vicinamibacterales bacterium]
MTEATGVRVPARIEIGPTDKTFASGLLLELVAALRQSSAGDLIALTAVDAAIGPDLDAWSRLTGHAIVGQSVDNGATRWVIRHGAAVDDQQDARPLGRRIWLYTNFDCNLACDYCCVRSSPTVARRALGLGQVERIAREARPLGVAEFCLTGGEPFLLPDIADIVLACAAVAPVTLLTNGMLFRGSRRLQLRRLPRDRVTLQISLDSPNPTLHDSHRGAGSWQRAWDGIQSAREDGFRVRLAATVNSDAEEEAFRQFLDHHHIAADDRVVRRVALRGVSTVGIALAPRDLVPEMTITAAGVYWHPVGAEDRDMLVTTEIFPLADALAAITSAVERERVHAGRLAQVFHCA